MIIISASVFVVSAIVLFVIHARVGKDHEHLLVPAGRVLLEVAPSTKLARKLSQGNIDHPLANLYRIVWYVHLLAGLVFAVSIMISAFFALR